MILTNCRCKVKEDKGTASAVPNANKRRVSGVAVTRHTVLVIPSIQVRTVDVDGKLDGPAMTVEFPCQVVLNDAAPAFREFLLNRLTLPDDRDHVGVVVRLQ